MITAMTDSQSSTLGGFYILAFFVIVGVAIYFANKRFGPSIRKNQRKRQVRAGMQYGMYDADLQSEVAREIIAERKRRNRNA